MPKVAVIMGTGGRKVFPDIEKGDEMETPYGSLQTHFSEEMDPDVPIVLRHGPNHNLPPHLVNYRANIAGLAQIGTERIISIGAVGSLRSSLRPEDIVLPDQFLDFTKRRSLTFVDRLEGSKSHVDVTNPFCGEMRKITMRSARMLEVAVHPRAVYACTEGPRYETAAEIRMFKMLGGDIVGMTCVPEVTLAREKGICYVQMSVVTNMAAGLKPQKITHRDVERIVANKVIQLRKLLKQVIEDAREAERECDCGRQPE